MDENAALQLAGQLGRVEGKLDGMLLEQTRVAARVTSLDEKMNARLSALEVRDNRLIGAAAAVSALVGFLSGWISQLVGGAP